ncbi:MAG: hypothetical protein ABW086_11440 [Sedimenticola sp.]
MKFMKQLSVAVILLLQLSGCVKTYDITPKYDSDANTLTIDSYVVDGVHYHHSKKAHFGAEDALQITIDTYKSDMHSCKELMVKAYSVQPEYILTISMHEEILNRHNGLCTIENLSNLYFMTCSATLFVSEGTIDKSLQESKLFLHYIASDDGVGDIRGGISILVSDAYCMGDIKNHFLSHGSSVELRRYNPEDKKWSSMPLN